MDIKPYDKTIKELLKSGSQFMIPRFQREYSWDKKNYQEFFEDMLNALRVDENGNVTTTPYFLGTMLFVGNYSEDKDAMIHVVDGQQRLTTITILFSAISDRFKECGEIELSKRIFEYIMTKDDDNREVRIIQSKTHYPFFSYFIQDINKENEKEPSTEEEVCIQETYKYLFRRLDENNLKKYLMKKYGREYVNQIKYLDLLKAIRNQVLETKFVSISTNELKQANMIFEILNAKGKRLANIDLIKNKLFDVLDQTEPADFAEETWKELKNKLNTYDIGLATYYSHFWNAMYKSTLNNKLYDDFVSVIKPKTKERYKEFLIEMNKCADSYIRIVNPTLDMFNRRKEYQEIVDVLYNLSTLFGIVQVRVGLLVLFKLWDDESITTKQLKIVLHFLEHFHFVYNALLSLRANKLRSIYGSFAKAIRENNDKNMVWNIIRNDLIQPLLAIMPDYTLFEQAFCKLTYENHVDDPNNVKTKYVINQMHMHYEKKTVVESNATIEHIYPENNKGVALNIGNLIMLESTINNSCCTKNYNEKKILYGDSAYKWIHSFIDSNEEWEIDCINDRAKVMAKVFYDDVVLGGIS